MFTFLDSIGDKRPIIYNGTEKPSKDFNAVQIRLNGRVDSSLNWKDQILLAQQAVADGYLLFWDLDLGLFSKLRAPLHDQAQLLTLGLSIQHFRDTIWKEFASYSFGISLYSGALDFTQLGESQNLNPRIFSLHCCDVALDYLNLLAGQLPGELPGCVLLDITALSDPLLLALLLSKERFDRLHRVVTEGVLPISSLTQSSEGIISSRSTAFSPGSDAKIGLCLPNRENCTLPHILTLEKALKNLMSQKIPFRIIPEATLTVEWDGLDQIQYSEKALSQQGMRKLRGFNAAGGILVNLD